jgi:hypothetical protein
MSTNTQKYGANIAVGWAWTLPNDAMDVPAIETTEDVSTLNAETGLEEITSNAILLSVRDYFAHQSSKGGVIDNRTVMPLLGGTHSTALFDSDMDDIVGFAGYLAQMGLVDGGRDFTLSAPNIFYSMPISRYDTFLAESPFNVEPVIVEEIV